MFQEQIDALVAVLEADEQHDDGNDGVEDGNLDPCLLGVTQTGDEREGNGGDDHVAEGGHTGTEQVVEGLISLGWRQQDAQQAVAEACAENDIPTPLATDDVPRVLRLALALMDRGR